jgi:D-Tyr-tRNAtyr deacylase
MNLSVQAIDAEIIVVSQFTLHASTKKAIVLLISKQQNQMLDSTL